MHKAAAEFSVRYFEDLQFEGLIELVNKSNIDHIHSHFASEATAIAHRVHQATGVPFSFTTHAFDLYKYLHPALLEWSNDAKRVFTISEFNKRFMCDEVGVDPHKVVVARCGICPENLTPCEYIHQPFKIISACRFVEKKGMPLLIAACQELKRQGVEFECEIVGDGDDAVAHQIRESGLLQEVTLKGSLVHPGMVDFLRSGSVFVLPCIQASDGDMDGIPVVLMEAMALRIPVISTTLSGIPELISHRKNGLLVPPGNVEALTNAIIEIKDNPTLVSRIRNESRQRILQSYNSMANTAKIATALQFGFPELGNFELPYIRFCESAETSLMDLNFEGLRNVFNPSFHITENLKILTFRAIPMGDDRLTSYVAVQDRLINISDFCLPLDCLQLIDPRVFQLKDEIWVSFNSGYVAGGNDIFVMKIYPQIEPPKKVIYRKRQDQERNWSFFSRNNELYALYWASPLKILKLKAVSDNAWEFEDFFSEDPNESSEFSDLTLGTQLTEFDGRYYFMGHRKYIVNGKKLYLGRSACLDFDKKTVMFGKHWFAYSEQSLRGSSTRHNNNLFSCTYFSGIQINDGVVHIGYGINDVDYGFSTYSLADFMGADS